MTRAKLPRLDRMWYGGDYNPEQWPRDVWDEDVRLMQRAGVTVATVAVFSWAKLEPEDGRFEFDWLDDVIEKLHAAGIRIDLATATASPPAWLVRAHPEMLPVTASGTRLEFGSRQHYHPNSAVYRRYALRLVRALAERYGSHPALEAWHVNNELACHVTHDYSPESAAAFRAWLRARYGDIATLNASWGTAFWSQEYSDFDQIEPPRDTPTFKNPGQQLDFDRFMSDAWKECLRAEAELLRELTPGVPITTNFMGFFKASDYWSWAEEVDFVSDDEYPDPADPIAPAYAAMTRDLMRSLSGGAPWILMEQAPSAVNWRPRNAAKAAGWHRLLSLQSIARGADGIMQFQWRQSRIGAEKFHSGMLPHAGEDTRVFRETVSLGAELAALSSLVGTRCPAARVAILFDWTSWWALEQESTPTSLSYLHIVFRWYRELWRRGVLVEFVKPGQALDGYDVVIAAGAVALSSQARGELARVVTRGGQLVVGYQTAVLDDGLGVLLGGYLGELQSVLGVRVEEFMPPAEPSLSGGAVPGLEISGLGAGTASEWGEVVRVHDADVLAAFVGGDLAGCPAVTRRTDASGGAGWYVATAPSALGEIAGAVLEAAGIEHALLPNQVEVVERGDHRFILNHSNVAVTVGEIEVAPRDAVIDSVLRVAV
ncbi:MAG: beta-galactosidase [Microbacterium sp.]